MKKIMLLLGAGIGFVAGSKAGNGPYQQLEAKIRELTKRPSGGQATDEPMPATNGYLADMAAHASAPKTTSPPETLMDVPIVLPAGTEL
jgi:hypothetical protein